ncbi:hypothetical protein [Sandaracinus amylolyticus]|uniref:Uncharacterized protein n=1 Tax=Sandaracinus amylolyticus TaxID=927083 RepID=A0A0F6YL78_9BACT|nr:hypothetical protein [Sandaracinus amylolyticus]AKF09026.1 hypothetical protein DB32_006175 [Sandaracinus amylolyticus]
MLALTVLVAPAVEAQAPPPAPDAYASHVVIDDVLAPLVEAAEVDVARGRALLGWARAEWARERVPVGSWLEARASVVIAAARREVGDGPTIHALMRDVVLAPLVAAAEGARDELALRRVEHVLANVDPESELARRATALRSILRRRLEPPATRVVLAPSAAPRPPPDPARRSDGELVDLYVSAGILGGYAGFWVPYALSLDDDGWYALSVLGGASLLALGVVGIDSDDGLRRGVASTLAVSIRYGMSLGFLLWGALDPELAPISSDRRGMAERAFVPLAGGLAGVLVGATIGLGLSPSVQHVRFVETAGLWGTALGLLVANAASTDGPTAFALGAGGLGAGVVVAALVAGAGVRADAARGWLLTLGFASGTLVAGIVALIAQGEPSLFGMVGVGTSVGGLALAFLLTEVLGGDHEHAYRIAALEGVRVTPIDGGAMVSLSGAL